MKLEEIANVIGGRLDNDVIKIRYKNSKFNIPFLKEHSSNRIYVPSEMSIQTKINSKFGFMIFKEDILDKISKIIGTTEEYNTGFEIFDKKFLIKVDNKAYAEKLFKNSEFRGLIHKIFSSGFKCLSCSGEDLELSTYPYILDPEIIKMALSSLSKITEILEEFFGYNKNLKRTNKKVKLKGDNYLTFKEGENYFRTIVLSSFEALKINITNDSFYESGLIVGVIDDFKIISQTYNINDVNRSSLEINLNGNFKINTTLDIAGETIISTTSKFIGICDIETGINDFDESILIKKSDPNIILAFLNNRIRTHLLFLSENIPFKITNNSIKVLIKSKIKRSLLKSILNAMLKIGRDFSKDNSLFKRYSKNIKSDPVEEFRIQNIKALTSHSSMNKKIQKLLSEALSDSSTRVQIEAARHLEKNGMHHLIKIMEDPYTPIDQLIEMVRILKTKKFTESIEVLKKTYKKLLTIKKSQSIKLKILILKTFKDFSKPDLNSFLIDELDKEFIDDLDGSKTGKLYPYIIQALGTCGKVNAVEKLFKFGKSTLNASIQKYINNAIKKIQSRLGNVEKGWLSMSKLKNVDGALSLSNPSTKGALSINTKSGESKSQQKSKKS